jgi:latrophilin 1
MDAHNYTGKNLGLEILTIVLCAFSFMALFLSIIIFSTFHGIESERTSITKNLALCLLIGNTFVLLILDRNYFNLSEGVCTGSGMLTHYIFLAAFGWMGVEGVHLYRMVVHVFDSEKNPLRIYRLFSYGVPLIIVMLTAMIGYLRGHSPYGGHVV